MKCNELPCLSLEKTPNKNNKFDCGQCLDYQIVLFCLFQLMAAMGNDAARAKYEQKVPAFYYRPTHTDCK